MTISKEVTTFCGQLVFDEDRWQDFSKRISSFLKNSDWSLKPVWLSPSFCAQNGWVCPRNDILKCISCRTTINVQMPDITEHRTYKSWVSTTLSLIKSAHKSHCPWILNPCPDRFSRMALNHKKEALNEFHFLTTSLLPFKERLPVTKCGYPSELNASETDYMKLLQHINLIDEKSSRYLLDLALIGWAIIDEEGAEYLFCHFCQRRVKLNVLRHKDKEVKHEVKEELREDSGVEMPALSSQTKQDTQTFDPVYEHRNWCRWKIDAMDHTSEIKTSIPGWLDFRKLLLSGCKDN